MIHPVLISKNQIRNIPDGQKLFYLQCKGEIEVLHKLNCITTYGNGDGLVIRRAMRGTDIKGCIRQICWYSNIITILLNEVN